jgi:hypothetical protein
VAPPAKKPVPEAKPGPYAPSPEEKERALAWQREFMARRYNPDLKRAKQ